MVIILFLLFFVFAFGFKTFLLYENFSGDKDILTVLERRMVEG